MKKQLVQEKIGALLTEMVEEPVKQTILSYSAKHIMENDVDLQEQLDFVKEMYQVVIDAGMAYALTMWTDKAIEMMEELYEVDEIEY